MSNINQNLKKLNSFTTHFKTFFNLSPKGKNINFQQQKKQNETKVKKKNKLPIFRIGHHQCNIV